MKRHYQTNNNDTKTISSTTTTPPAAPPPVSLGKPSLRHRLESYYTLVSPTAISNPTEWKQKFDLIYKKYGGTVKGERSLSTKLAKKYGTTVKLLIAPEDEEIRRIASGRGSSNKKTRNTSNIGQVEGVAKQKEEYYEVTPQQINSSVLNFASPLLDVHNVLQQPAHIVLQANNLSSSSSSDCTILDNLSKCRRLLPPCDPLYIPPIIPTTTTTTSTSSNSTSEQTQQQPKKKQKVPYASLMSTTSTSIYTSGPISLLHSIYTNHQRIKIQIRYVDCIRGTLSGYVLAFDKHLNMILRDVDEVYTSRVTSSLIGGGESWISKGELEKRRRLDCIVGSTTKHCSNTKQKMDGSCEKRKKDIIIKQRHIKQMLVRGDNIVMLWRANDEQSASSYSSGNALRSIYQTQKEDNNTRKKDVMKEEATTTMVSSGYIMNAALQRMKRKHQQQKQQQQQQEGNNTRYKRQKNTGQRNRW